MVEVVLVLRARKGLGDPQQLLGTCDQWVSRPPAPLGHAGVIP